MEAGMVPPEPAVTATTHTDQIDGRGGVTLLVVMTVISLWGLRSAPGPSEPLRIRPEVGEPWMAQALPGIGVKTRAVMWHHLQAGAVSELPARTRATALQVFDWSALQPEHDQEESASSRH